jgi:DNA polymerase III subunit epsilon
MRATTRFIIAVIVLGLLMTGPFLATATLVWYYAGDVERAVLLELIAPKLLVGGSLTAFAFVIGIAVVRNLYRRYVHGLLQMAENQQLMLEANRDFRITEQGPPEVKAVARATNALADQRDALLRDIEAQIARAKQSVEEEKNRLAALVAELTQSVVVCNLDGRILLYNSRARQEFRSLSDAPLVAGGGELIGLGRSIYAVFDRNLISHALETIQYSMRSSAEQPVAHFVTTGGAGQLLRVRMSPVFSGSGMEGVAPLGSEEEPHARRLTGFILMLDNITEDFAHELRRDQTIHRLTEGNRAALANIRAAGEMLEYPDLEMDLRKRFRRLIRDEVEAMSENLVRTASELADTLKARWPLEEMLGTDLVAAVQRRIESRLSVGVRLEELDDSLWVRVDSFSLLQALLFLVSRLAEELEVREVGFRLGGAGRLVHLDLIWSGPELSTGRVSNWELSPMAFAGESSPLTVRDVIDRHGGEIWLERDRNGGGRSFFRLLLPAASPREQVDPSTFVRSEGRPEYYDFDLFKWSEKSRELDERLLTDLTYTVFDTETTGLNPSEGDEIIQIGATRIVNGKMLRHESFEQLVDPRRPLAPESIPIHGIQPEMLAGQPTIDQVLPAFHAFAAETVLIGHNAAFDMRFLQMKEKLTGLVFDQPVLDTLLLSVVMHPHQDSHRLDVIAERLNVAVVGRHTALGDAIVTAEIFIRMIPLLAEKGIRTLRQAREAAEQTFYARIKY